MNLYMDWPKGDAVNPHDAYDVVLQIDLETFSETYTSLTLTGASCASSAEVFVHLGAVDVK